MNVIPFDDLRAALRDSIEALVEALPLGERNRHQSNRSQLRFGSKGSLRVWIAGPKRGGWSDFSGDGRGNPIGLIQHAHSCDFAEAVAWARNWLGTPEPERKRARPQPRREPTDDEAAEIARKIGEAKRIARGAAPIVGSLGEYYLKQVRGIAPGPSGDWPASIHWHPGERAVLAIATTADGAVQAVHRIHLAEDGGKIGEDERHRRRLPAVKVTNGSKAGAAVRLPGKLPVLLAEGVETGLAAWSATGHEVWIALGPISQMTDVPAFAIALAEDYPRHHQAEKALGKALRTWRAKGREVVVCRPWPQRRGNGSDLADVILIGGADAVRARIRAALEPVGPELRRVPLTIARVRLERAVQHFVAAAEKGSPLVHAIRVDLGGGKSTAFRRELAPFVRRLRSADDRRPVVVSVPTHKLADEAAYLMKGVAPDLAVETWRGRKADAPNRPGKMCQAPERVNEARKVRLDVIEFACNGCAFRADCEYLGQHDKRADVWFVTHASLEHRIPAAIGEPAMLVVDETPMPNTNTTTLPLLDLARHDAVDRDRMATERLTFLRRRVLDALAEAEDGPLMSEPFRALSMTTESATELCALEWRTLIEPKPGDRKQALREAAQNADLGARAMLALALEKLLQPDRETASGLAELRTGEDGRRRLVLQAPSRVHDTWRAAPTLILDGTLRMEVLHQTWPTAELIADVAIEAPHQRVRQCADIGFTLSSLNMDATDITDAERKRRARNLRRLRVMLHTEARQYAGARVLVVGNKAVIARLASMGLPANVDTATFGSLRGIDRWRDVRALVMVGWTLPRASDIEHLAGALTGVAVPATDYVRSDATRLLADGTTLLSESWKHPDPLVEALRWSTCEAELLQSIARGRGVQRTAANPLDVLVLGEAVLPFQVDMVSVANPSPAETQLVEGGIAYAEPGHTSQAYPDLWRTSGAARMAETRWRTNPYVESYIGECAPPLGTLLVRFQVAGIGKRPAEAMVDLTVTPDPRTAIEAALGPLTKFELIQPASPPKTCGSSPRGVAPHSVTPIMESRWKSSPSSWEVLEIARDQVHPDDFPTPVSGSHRERLEM